MIQTPQIFQGKDYKLFIKNNLHHFTDFITRFHANELAHINSATNESVRQQRANAYALLKLDQSYWVDHNNVGAPILMINKQSSEFSISLSHKKNAVAAAISTTENKSIGIDLELLNTGKDFNFLKDKVISANECTFLNKIQADYQLTKYDSPLFFWSLKEAAFKAVHGKFPMTDFEIDFKENKLILSCIAANIDAKQIFIPEIIISENSLIAVVMTSVQPA